MAALFRSNIGLLIVVVILAGSAQILERSSVSFADEAQNHSSLTSLCRSEEQVFFSCTIAASNKIVSLCGAKIIDTRRGYVQYRFGRVGALELQYPRERANTQRVFRYAHHFRAKVDRSEITFDNQDFRYVVFDYYEGDVRPAIKEAGVRITLHRSEQETVLKCFGNPISSLGNLESIVPRDMDNPLNR